MNPYKEEIAVIGAGLMGCGIAQVFAVAGHRVSLFDPSAEARRAADGRLAAILADLGLDRPAGAVVVRAEIEPAVEVAEFVVEAGPERLEIKQEIFAELDRFAPSKAILATNTSAIPIMEIADVVRDKGRVVGSHFWNPPHLVSLVEVIEARLTTTEVVDDALDLLRRCGMKAVHVRADIPGFIGNRLQHALKREAIALVAAGHCSAETLDEVVKQGFGARLATVGPLEQSDLVGLDLTLDIHRVLMPSLDRTDVPHPYLVSKVEAGETGAAVGRGFRDWTPGTADAARRRVRAALIEHHRGQIERESRTDRRERRYQQ